jgi:hypothetical protein
MRNERARFPRCASSSWRDTVRDPGATRFVAFITFEVPLLGVGRSDPGADASRQQGIARIRGAAVAESGKLAASRRPSLSGRAVSPPALPSLFAGRPAALIGRRLVDLGSANARDELASFTLHLLTAQIIWPSSTPSLATASDCSRNVPGRSALDAVQTQLNRIRQSSRAFAVGAPGIEPGRVMIDVQQQRATLRVFAGKFRGQALTAPNDQKRLVPTRHLDRRRTTILT